jgi:thioredoxin reductase
LNIRFNYEVNSILKLIDGTFSINDGDIIADKVFVGIGVSPKEVPFQVHPSIQAYTYANMPLDKEIYRDKTVVIVGLGNAALETADFIAPVTKFTLLGGRNKNAWYTHYPGHTRSKNYTSIDSMFLKAASFTIFCEDGVQKYSESLEYKLLKELLETAKSDIVHTIDIAIFCIGFRFHLPMVSGLVDICPTSGFPVLNSSFESTKTPGLYFIGATSQAHDYKHGTSAFIHGFRYNCEYISRNLKGIEYQLLSRDDMIKTVFRQINKSSCLLHRFDYFCDVVEKLPDGMWKYTKEIPLRPARENEFTLRLGYTNSFPNKGFFQPTFIHPKLAHLCIYIHPIFETSSKQMFELPEDIYNEFSDKNWHILPFIYFLNYIEGTMSTSQVRSAIELIPDKRGGRDMFWAE